MWKRSKKAKRIFVTCHLFVKANRATANKWINSSNRTNAFQFASSFLFDKQNEFNWLWHVIEKKMIWSNIGTYTGRLKTIFIYFRQRNIYIIFITHYKCFLVDLIVEILWTVRTIPKFYFIKCIGDFICKVQTIFNIFIVQSTVSKFNSINHHDLHS